MLTMKNRFGKLMSIDEACCDRKGEMLQTMAERKRAREEALSHLTNEGDGTVSDFSKSRCLGGYVSWSAPKACSSCGVETKFYQLYKTTREWEEEWCENSGSCRKKEEAL